MAQTTTAHGGPRVSREAGDALGLPSVVRSALAEVAICTAGSELTAHRAAPDAVPRPGAEPGRRTDVDVEGGAPERFNQSKLLIFA